MISASLPLFAITATSSPNATLGGLDWLAICGYFGILACVGWWVVRKGKGRVKH